MHHAVIFLLGLVMHAMTAAAGVDEATVRAWLLARLEAPPAIESLRNIKLVIESETSGGMTDEELEGLVREVEGKPDHPRRSALLVERWRRDPARRPALTTVWLGDSETWRLSQDLPWAPPEVAFIDAASRSDGAWRLMPQEILLSAPLRDSARAAQPLAMHRGTISASSGFFDGGLHRKRGNPPALLGLEVSGSNWKAVIEGNFARSTIQGRWDEDSGVGLVSEDQMEVSVPGQPAAKTEVRYSGWTRKPDVGWVATEIDVRDSRTMQTDRRILRSLEFVSADEIASVCKTPGASSVDPVRGQLKVRTITDSDERGARHGLAAPQANVPRLPEPGRLINDRWRVYAWVMLGLLAVILLVLRLRAGGR